MSFRDLCLDWFVVSRLRGNDVGVRGNDVGVRGNDVGVRGNDGLRCCDSSDWVAEILRTGLLRFFGLRYCDSI